MNYQGKLYNFYKVIKVMHIVGARPNFMKISPVLKEMSRYPKKFDHLLVHTGQHYNKEMSKFFFNDLRLNKPDIYLGVGSGSHAEQTGKIMIKFEKVCFQERPNLVIVVGDVNSTIACALVAAKLCIPIAHIEAGLRSFDRTMPEEINRLLTDQIAEYLFTTCEEANQNLIREGVSENKIFFVGNTMVDTLLTHMKTANKSFILEKLGLRRNNEVRKYAVVTLHRPSNVDKSESLKGILVALNELSKEIPIIFPAHPRTIKQIKYFNLLEMVNYEENFLSNKLMKTNCKVMALPPLGYIDFLCLLSNSTIVLTDSGGIQEETTILGIPCLTLRNNTERPITIKEGTNIIVGNNPDKIIKEALRVLKNGIRRKKNPKYWDGKAAKRIVSVLKEKI